jgi:hypothetical protein
LGTLANCEHMARRRVQGHMWDRKSKGGIGASITERLSAREVSAWEVSAWEVNAWEVSAWEVNAWGVSTFEGGCERASTRNWQHVSMSACQHVSMSVQKRESA